MSIERLHRRPVRPRSELSPLAQRTLIVVGLLLAIPARAQDTSTQSNEKKDDVVVTGSRRTDTTAITSSTPIDVVSAEQLQQTGGTDLSKLLQTDVPSFHFTQDNPSTSVQYAVKGASLHGLGPDETLVLVNGIRQHLNAQLNTGYLGYGRGTQVVDLDVIPADSIGRVEVLEDGASAQYGSDAIAGVVNIVLKTDTEFHISNQVGSYTALGQGIRDNASVSWGVKLANGGFFHVTGEIVSATPVDIAIDDTRQFYFTGDPREATASRHWFYGSGEYQKYGTMLNGEIPLSDTVKLFGYSNIGYRVNYGFANFRRPDDDGNVRAIYPDGFQPLQRVRSTDDDTALGLKHDGGLLGVVSLTASYGSSRASIYTYDTVNASLGTASGTAGSSGITYNDDLNVMLDQVRSVDIGKFAGPLTIASGLAYRHERYQIVAGDSFTWVNGGQPILDGPDAGKPAALGSQGASGFQPADAGVFTRNVGSGYLDVSAKPVTWFDIDLAGRADHYSDFGWTTNGKVSARLAPLHWLALRGSVSTGFRAPSISQLDYSRTTGIFINNIQYLQRILPANSAPAEALGAQPLKPEKSTNFTGGVVLTPAHRTLITADYYHIDVNNRIVLTGTLQGKIVSNILAAAGFPLLQGAQFFTNGVDTTTQGLDVIARQSFQIARGELALSTGFNLTQTHLRRVAPDPGPLATSGIVLIDRQQLGFITSGSPNTKLIMSATYSRGKVGLTATGTRYGTYSFINQTTPSLDQTFSPQWVGAISGQWNFASKVRLDAGIDNLFNSKPDQQIVGARNPNVSLYSSLSPVGAYGTFTYGRLTFGF